MSISNRPPQLIETPANITPMGISQFSMNKTINEPVTQFDFTINARTIINAVTTGRKILFNMQDLYGSSNPAQFSGRIERNNRIYETAKMSYTMHGRNNGVYLIEQPINFPAYKITTPKLRVRDVKVIMARIVKGTGVLLGPEIQRFRQDFTNDPDEDNWFFGEYGTKKEAIDALLVRYGQMQGYASGWFRWYIDIDGYLRIFKVGDGDFPRSRPEIEFSITHPNVFKIEIDETAENIKNDITVIGGESNTLRARAYNMDSIKRYGRRVADVMSDSSLLTMEQVQAEAQAQVEYLSQPIWVGTIEMAGFPRAEPGMGTYFPFDPQYADKKFIITAVRHSGSPGNYRTYLDYSTDENVIVIPNMSDIYDNIIKQRVKESAPVVATVTSVDKEENTVTVQPVGLMSGKLSAKQSSALASTGVLKARLI